MLFFKDMKNSTLRISSIISLFVFLSLVIGCTSQSGSGTESGTTVHSDPNNLPQFNPTRMVCDPFQTNSQQARDRGLVGNLVYLTNDQIGSPNQFSTIDDYINFAVLAPVTIYLDRLYTPPRPFNLGFYTRSGDLVKTENGDTIYKNFGIRMTSQLQLAENENPGYYQLALIASTGGRIKTIDSSGTEKIIVSTEKKHDSDNSSFGYHENDEEDHDDKSNGSDEDDDDSEDAEAKVVCADEPIYLDHNTKIPAIVEYYQGKSQHISLIAMWRPWPGPDNSSQSKDEDEDEDDNDDHDKNRKDFCHRSVKSLFKYSSTAPATPKDQYYEMLANNWKVLENENYKFPEQDLNPCLPTEEPLAITGFSITNITRNSVTLTWTTNIPATSQGESKVVSTGVVTTSNLDMALVQNHSITITGLAPNTLYAVRSLSTTTSGQSAFSDERAFRTPR